MLDVPTPTKAGESVELSCIFDLEKDKLYSVKVGSWILFPELLPYLFIKNLSINTLSIHLVVQKWL